MPNVMIRRDPSGKLSFYVAKKDLEETIARLEFDGPDGWGGEVELMDGSRYYLEPLSTMPNLPITLRARRL
ncbi:putative nitrogen fixation protein NifT [Acidihalobacter prosperus]|uniref:Protein NifT n=1 Tax=Acidihalobacter prosperus TaxID=160660 RepID=A0A1A6C7N7_9GAMM|nr:putative nitrogen fixation protein NifT [Acidihalobacter prosperus]OBS10577.1 protein NifT [Acidihalobacter prosperus]